MCEEPLLWVHCPDARPPAKEEDLVVLPSKKLPIPPWVSRRNGSHDESL